MHRSLLARSLACFFSTSTSNLTQKTSNQVYDDGGGFDAFEAPPSSIHFGGGGPERSFFPVGADGGRRHQLQRLAAAVSADRDVVSFSASLVSLFAEEEDVRNKGKK